jgi:hypothetical protein
MEVVDPATNLPHTRRIDVARPLLRLVGSEHASSSAPRLVAIGVGMDERASNRVQPPRSGVDCCESWGASVSEELLAALRVIEAQARAIEALCSRVQVESDVSPTSNAERQARYRERRRVTRVTSPSVTSNVTSNVTGGRGDSLSHVSDSSEKIESDSLSLRGGVTSPTVTSVTRVTLPVTDERHLIRNESIRYREGRKHVGDHVATMSKHVADHVAAPVSSSSLSSVFSLSREEETRKEERKTDTETRASDHVATMSPTRRACRMPLDDGERRDFCLRWGIPQDHALYKRFEDWALSSPKAVKMDWRRTWSGALAGWLGSEAVTTAKPWVQEQKDPYEGIKRGRELDRIEREAYEAKLLREAEAGAALYAARQKAGGS